MRVCFVFDGVVVPPLDDDLCEEDEGNGIEGGCGVVLPLKFSVVV